MRCWIARHTRSRRARLRRRASRAGKGTDAERGRVQPPLFAGRTRGNTRTSRDSQLNSMVLQNHFLHYSRMPNSEQRAMAKVVNCHLLPATADAPNSRLPVLHYRNVLPNPLSEDSAIGFLTANEWEHRVSSRGFWETIMKIDSGPGNMGTHRHPSLPPEQPRVLWYLSRLFDASRRADPGGPGRQD